MNSFTGVGICGFTSHADDGAVQCLELGGAAVLEIGVHGVLEVRESPG